MTTRTRGRKQRSTTQSTVPEKGDKVFLSGRKTGRVITAFKMVVVSRDEKGRETRERHAVLSSPGKTGKEVYTVAIADLVRDVGRRGWRERWRQEEMFDPDAMKAATTSRDKS